MKASEATEILGLVQAAWPGMKLPEVTQAVWGEALIGQNYFFARKAVAELAQFQSRPPALADLLAATDEVRRENAALALPLPDDGRPTGGYVTFAEWLATYATSEQKTSVKRVFPTVASKYGIGPDLEEANV